MDSTQAGANMESKDKSGHTPLFLACEENHPEVVEVLIDAGANKDGTVRQTDAISLSLMYSLIYSVLLLAPI